MLQLVRTELYNSVKVVLHFDIIVGYFLNILLPLFFSCLVLPPRRIIQLLCSDASGGESTKSSVHLAFLDNSE